MAGLAGFVDATASGDLFASSFEDGFHSVGVGEPVEIAGAAGYPVEQDEESVAALPTAVREFGGQHVEVVGVPAEVVRSPRSRAPLNEASRSSTSNIEIGSNIRTASVVSSW